MSEDETHIRCSHCSRINRLPSEFRSGPVICGYCGQEFSVVAESPTGDTSAAVGLIGGAALGAAIGGPVGAVVGGLLGALIGKETKGVG